MAEIKNLRFQLLAEGGTCIVNVDLDDQEKISDISSNDPDLERIIKRGGNIARLQDQVDAITKGIISSDQLELKNHGHSKWYKVEHLP